MIRWLIKWILGPCQHCVRRDELIDLLRKENKDQLDRLMARNFQEYAFTRQADQDRARRQAKELIRQQGEQLKKEVDRGPKGPFVYDDLGLGEEAG